MRSYLREKVKLGHRILPGGTQKDIQNKRSPEGLIEKVESIEQFVRSA